MRRIIKFASIALLLSLGACASKTTSRFGDAATAPLADLNLIRDKIPPVLADAQAHPYDLPAPANCLGIAIEIHDLDTALGPDLDAPAALHRDTSMLDRSSTYAEDQAVGAVRRTAEGLVPFRSWVRKLSGAERHSKEVSAAINAGSVRRAFLKGIAATRGCPLPPAPRASTAPQPPETDSKREVPVVDLSPPPRS